MSEPWGFLVVALCAIVGYIVVAAFLGKRGASQKHCEGAPHAQDSGHDKDTTEQWYEILNVSPSASVEEIQTAFRTEIAKYHPDRVASFGFELRALAESCSKKINVAHVEGLRMRGTRGSTRR